MSCRAEARRNLSEPTMYCCRANSFSSRESCSLVKLVRIRFDFPPFDLYGCSPALTLDTEAAEKEMTHLIALRREYGHTLQPSDGSLNCIKTHRYLARKMLHDTMTGRRTAGSSNIRVVCGPLSATWSESSRKVPLLWVSRREAGVEPLLGISLHSEQDSSGSRLCPRASRAKRQW